MGGPQGGLKPFGNRNFPPMTHTSGFRVKIKKTVKYTVFVKVVIFSEVLPKTSNNDA